MGSNDDNYSKRGRFLPKERFNVGQSPLPFATDVEKNYGQVTPGDKENRNKKVWVRQPYSGADNRQYSLNICFSPEGEQPRIAVNFSWPGKKVQ